MSRAYAFEALDPQLADITEARGVSDLTLSQTTVGLAYYADSVLDGEKSLGELMAEVDALPEDLKSLALVSFVLVAVAR